MDPPSASILTHSYAVWRRSVGLDAGGCPVSEYTAVPSATAIRCRPQPHDDVEAVVNDVERSRVTHIIWSAHADVRASDRLVITAPTEAVYDVISVHDPNDQHVYMKLLVEIVV